MNSKQGLILVICSMILAGEVASFPTDVYAKTTSFTEEDAIALENALALEQEDFDFKSILKKLPNFVLKMVKKIIKGILKDKKPLEIMLSILDIGNEKKKNKKDKKKNKKKEEKGEKEGNKPEPEPEKPETDEPEPENPESRV